MGETVVTAQARIETVSISAPDPGDVAITWGQPVASEDRDTAEFVARRCLVDLAPGVVLHLDTLTDDPTYVDRLIEVLGQVRERMGAGHAK